MEWLPGARAAVTSEAVPVLTATGEPSGLPPSKNWMVPPAVAGAIVAVNVMFWRANEGFGIEPMEMPLVALLIVRVPLALPW